MMKYLTDYGMVQMFLHSIIFIHVDNCLVGREYDTRFVAVDTPQSIMMYHEVTTIWSWSRIMRHGEEIY